jgi:hypothetical protein
MVFDERERERERERESTMRSVPVNKKAPADDRRELFHFAC